MVVEVEVEVEVEEEQRKHECERAVQNFGGGGGGWRYVVQTYYSGVGGVSVRMDRVGELNVLAGRQGRCSKMGA